MASHKNDQAVAEIREAFNVFDTNRDGKIDFEELKQALIKLGNHASHVNNCHTKSCRAL